MSEYGVRVRESLCSKSRACVHNGAEAMTWHQLSSLSGYLNNSFTCQTAKYSAWKTLLLVQQQNYRLIIVSSVLA